MIGFWRLVEQQTKSPRMERRAITAASAVWPHSALLPSRCSEVQSVADVRHCNTAMMENQHAVWSQSRCSIGELKP